MYKQDYFVGTIFFRSFPLICIITFFIKLDLEMLKLMPEDIQQEYLDEVKKSEGSTFWGVIKLIHIR